MVVLAHLVGAGVLALAATAWGPQGNGRPGFRRLARALGSGLIVLSCLTALVGALHLLYPAVLAVIGGLPLLWPGRARRAARLWTGTLRLWTRPSWVEAGVLLFVVCGVLSALVPNTHYDVEVYHYTLPRLYLERHALYWTDTSSFDGSFQLVHQLYALAMSLGGEVQANLLAPLFEVLLVLGLAAMAPTRRAGAVAALLMVSSPVMFAQTAGGLVDLPCAAFAMLALDAWVLGRRSRRWRAWAWCWLFGSAAVGVRSTGALVPVILACMVVPWSLRRAGLVLASSLTLALPWMLRNAVVTGDPLYPLLSGWMGYAADSVQAHPAYLLQAVVGSTGSDPYAWQGAINPLVAAGLCLSPLAPAWRWRRSCTVAGLVAVALTWPLADNRYLLPGVAWLSVAAAPGLQSVSLFPAWARRSFLALCTGVVAVGALLQLGMLVPRLPVLCGRQTADDYLRAHSPLVAAYEWMKTCPLAGAILIQDRRGFRCPRDFAVVDAGILPWSLRDLESLPADRVQERLRRRGANLILWDLRNPSQRLAMVRYEVRDLDLRRCSLDVVASHGLLKAVTRPHLLAALATLGAVQDGDEVILPYPQGRDGYTRLAWTLRSLAGDVVYASDEVVIQRLDQGRDESPGGR